MRLMLVRDPQLEMEGVQQLAQLLRMIGDEPLVVIAVERRDGRLKLRRYEDGPRIYLMPKGEELSVEQQTVLRHEGCTHAIPVASGLDALDRVRQIIEGDPAAREWGL